MSGFLDSNAPSIWAEYIRYLASDLLGKIVFKNFAINVLKVEPKHLRIPLSRHGDLGLYKDTCDAEIRYGNRWYSVETKCSWQVVAKRCKTDPKPRWVFSRLTHSPKGVQRSEYDLVFAVGINAPGLEDSIGYWSYMKSLKKQHQAANRSFELSVWPHEPDFLNLCGIYILPREAVSLNQLDITIHSLTRRRDSRFFGWGYESRRLENIWRKTIQIVNASISIDPLVSNIERKDSPDFIS